MRLALLTLLAMTAFAGNSILCRLALREGGIDPASFTTIRLLAGAATLWAVTHLRTSTAPGRGNWVSALSLYAYAAAFSFAYVTLSAGTGALLLFGAVQATMLGYSLLRGEPLTLRQGLGSLVAIAGLVYLVLPGVNAPSLYGSLLMLLAGIAWGTYSIRGRAQGDPTRVSSENFLYAAPMAVLVTLCLWGSMRLPLAGVLYALLSGAVTSGLGYAIWYTVLPQLRGTTAASVQLGVPVIAAFCGVVFLGEALTARMVVASLAIVGGIWLATAPAHHR